MNGNSQPKQPAVRPGLLIFLLIILGGALYWNFFMQPKPAPVSPAPPATTAAPLTNNINTLNQPETQDPKLSTGPVSKRDLFLPPPSIIVARRSKDNNDISSNKPVWNEPKLIKPGQEISNAKVNENPEKPILKGIVGTASTQVIIVRYQNKSYLLKLGEILPGTEYRVAEISGSEVVLLSPKGRLKLDKKERAK